MWCAAKGQTRQGIMHGVPWHPWRDIHQQGWGLKMAQSKSLIFPWKMVIFSITSYVNVYQRPARNNWFLMIFKIIFPVKKNKPNYGGGSFVQALRSGADAMPMPSWLRLDRPVKIKGVAGKTPAFGGPCVSLIEASQLIFSLAHAQEKSRLRVFPKGQGARKSKGGAWFSLLQIAINWGHGIPRL